jgi:hypothetical protein
MHPGEIDWLGRSLGSFAGLSCLTLQISASAHTCKRSCSERVSLERAAAAASTLRRGTLKGRAQHAQHAVHHGACASDL